jgi:hypothetical protein
MLAPLFGRHDTTGQDVEGFYDKYVQRRKFYRRFHVGVLVITHGFGQSNLALSGCNLLWAKRMKTRSQNCTFVSDYCLANLQSMLATMLRHISFPSVRLSAYNESELKKRFSVNLLLDVLLGYVDTVYFGYYS